MPNVQDAVRIWIGVNVSYERAFKYNDIPERHCAFVRPTAQKMQLIKEIWFEYRFYKLSSEFTISVVQNTIYQLYFK